MFSLIYVCMIICFDVHLIILFIVSYVVMYFVYPVSYVSYVMNVTSSNHAHLGGVSDIVIEMIFIESMRLYISMNQIDDNHLVLYDLLS